MPTKKTRSTKARSTRKAPTQFERFAMDHQRHVHCVACGGCLVGYRENMARAIDAALIFWCVGCMEKIDRKLPDGVRRPWYRGIVFNNPGGE